MLWITSVQASQLTQHNFYPFYSVVKASQKGIGKDKRGERNFHFHGCSQLLAEVGMGRCEFLPSLFSLIPIYWLSVSCCCLHPFLHYTVSSHVKLQTTPSLKIIYFLLISLNSYLERSQLTKGIHTSGNDLYQVNFFSRDVCNFARGNVNPKTRIWGSSPIKKQTNKPQSCRKELFLLPSFGWEFSNLSGAQP